MPLLKANKYARLNSVEYFELRILHDNPIKLLSTSHDEVIITTDQHLPSYKLPDLSHVGQTSFTLALHQPQPQPPPPHQPQPPHQLDV